MARPRKYKSVKTMQKAIRDYFDKTEKITICGLALHLGFNSRQSLLDYEGYSDEFMDTLRTAKMRVEAYYEEHLLGSNASGVVFALKNFKWRDKSEVVVKDKEGLTEQEREGLRDVLRAHQKPLKLVKGA